MHEVAKLLRFAGVKVRDARDVRLNPRAPARPARVAAQRDAAVQGERPRTRGLADEQ